MKPTTQYKLIIFMYTSNISTCLLQNSYSYTRILSTYLFCKTTIGNYMLQIVVLTTNGCTICLIYVVSP